MKNTKIENRVVAALLILIIFCFGILLNKYVVASANEMYITGATSVEEGKSISFTITFNDNVNNIWLSDGDIIKVGFSGVVNVDKISNNKYNVNISNISNVGDGKCIVVNSGVGYIDGKPTMSATSNVFSITEKKVENNDNNNNNNQNNNTNNNQNNADNNTSNNQNNNTNNNVNNNSNNNNNQNNNTNNNNQNNNNSNVNSDINKKPNVNNNTNNNNINKPNNTKPNTNISNHNNIQSNTNNLVNNEIKNVENSDLEKNEEKVDKVKRQIPNTGKIF